MENAGSWTVSGSKEAMGVPRNFKDLRKLGVQNIAQYSAAIYGAYFVSKFKHAILRFKLQTCHYSFQTCNPSIQTFKHSILRFKHSILRFKHSVLQLQHTNTPSFVYLIVRRRFHHSSLVTWDLARSRAESDALTLFRNEMTTAADTGETSYKGMYGKF